MKRYGARIGNATLQRIQTFWMLAAVASVMFAIAGSAQTTTASSGFVSWVPNVYLSGYGTTNIKLRAEVVGYSDGVLNNRGSTSVGLTLPPGWIATWVAGYMNGGWCGTSVLYNTVATDYWSIVSAPCGNPAGSQTFRTGMSGQVWNGTDYISWGAQYSPNLVY